MPFLWAQNFSEQHFWTFIQRKQQPRCMRSSATWNAHTNHRCTNRWVAETQSTNIPLRGMCLLGFLYHTVVTGREHNTYNNIRVKITILIHRIPDLSQHVQCMCLAPHDTWCFSNAPSIFLSFSVSTFPSEYYLETAVSITMHQTKALQLTWAMQ